MAVYVETVIKAANHYQILIIVGFKTARKQA